MHWKGNKTVQVAVFLLMLTLIFFGRALVPAEGWALGGLDVRGLFYPWWEMLRNSVFAGRMPWWDANTFAGYPFLSNPQVAAFYPLTWLAVLPPVRIGITLYLVVHFWLGGMGVFLLVRSLGKENCQLSMGAVIAAVTFMFSGFFTARVYAGHIGLIGVHMWVPWILLGTVWCVRRGDVWSAVVAGAAWGMAVLAGHTTSLLYVGVVWGCFVIWLLGFDAKRQRGEEGKGEKEHAEAQRHRDMGGRIITTYHLLIIRQVFVMGVVGLLLALVQLLPLMEFARVAGRTAEATYEFATGFSFPPSHLVTLLVPQFFGEPTVAGYWSVPNFEELAAYAGVVPLIGLLVALRRPDRQTWLWVGMMVLGVLLAFGSYGFLYRIFYDWVPPFRLARAPGRAMFLYVLGAAVLLGVTLERWWHGEQDTGWLKWVLGSGLAAGLATIAATGAVFAAEHPSETSGRLWVQIGGWVVATGVFVVGVGIFQRKGAQGHRVQKGGDEEKRGAAEQQSGRAGANDTQYTICNMRRNMRRNTPPNTRRSTRRSTRRNTYHISLFTAHFLLLALVIVDLWLFGFKFVRTEPMTPDLFWFEAREVIESDGGNGRVLPWGISIFSQNGAAQVGLESVFGYNALEVGANNQLAASVPDPRSTAYDILGARYLVATTPQDQFVGGEDGLLLLRQNGSAWVYARPQTLPLVRFVGDVEVIAEQARAIARVHEKAFDPARTVLVAEEPGCVVSEEGEGTAEVVARRPGYWRIETVSAGEQMLVVSETAYPGWEVLVDGERVEWQTAYTAVRAVCVPAGTHVVEWVYRPWVYLYGGIGSLVGVGLVILAAWRVWRED